MTESRSSLTTMSVREIFAYSVLSGLLRTNVLSEFREVCSRLNWPGEKLRFLRAQRFRELIDHATEQVGYYRSLFRSVGLKPADVTLDTISQVPVLTRQLLRENFDQLKAGNKASRKVELRSTGGTTGTPVSVLLDGDTFLERLMVTHRMYCAMGRSLGVRTLLVAGSPIDSKAWRTLRDRFKNILFNVDVTSSFALDRPGMNALFERLRVGRYQFVIAYASVFDLIAQLASERGKSLHLPAIVACAELVSASQRAAWAKAFGAEVFEIYGSRELTSIAGETRDHAGLLVNNDVYHLEITDAVGNPAPPGTPGLITITNLIERSMPLIRYQLGDIGCFGPPPAEDPWGMPRLHITHGRILDVIRTRQGKWVPGEFFPHLFKEVVNGVRQYQVVQVNHDELQIKVVADLAFTEHTRTYLVDRVQRVMGPETRIVINRVDMIEPSASGKFRTTIGLPS